MELTIDQALQKAVEAHKAGQIQEADRLYTAILQIQPKHPDANHNMGILAVGVGKVDEALPFLKMALEANPSIAQFWFSFIDALIKLDRIADAKAVFDQARSNGAKGDGFDRLNERIKEADVQNSSNTSIAKTSESIQQHFLDIAIQLRDMGEYDQAIDLLKEEIPRLPEEADLLALLSHCCILADELEEAKLYLDRARKIAPENASVGWNTARLKLKEKNVSEALNVANDTSRRFPDDIEGMGVLGACLRANGEMVESLEVLNRALALNPDYAEALINRGLISLSQENKSEALADLEAAHRLKPHIKQIWDLVVGLKVEAQEYSDAIPLLIKMIEIDSEDEKRLATLALCYQHLKNFDLAIEAYIKVLAFMPDNLAAQTNLGSALKEQGKLEEAIEAYKKALSIEPNYAEAYNNIGIVLKEQEKLEEAIRAYDNALTIKPDYAEAYNNMGVTLQIQGKLKEAIRAYDNALTIKPDYAEAYNNMGITLQEQGKLAEAIDAYGKALAIKPEYASAYNNIGNALKEQGKLEEAIKAYQKALAIKPDNADAYNNIGNALKEQGKPEEAIDAYKKALAIKPDYAEAYYNMSNALKEQGKLAEAIDSYEKALAIKPDYAEAYYNMSNALKEQGKLAEAIDSYEKALAIKPDYAEAYYNMSNALKEQGKLEEAIESYREFLAIKPDHAEAYNNMGLAFKEQGKLEEAIESYKKALAIKPEYASAYNNIGNALKEQGKLEEAIKAYQKALAKKPDYAEPYNNMGITLQEQGKLAEAIDAYKKALTIKPDYAEPYNNMGVTLHEQGKLAEAIDAYDKALAIKPDNADAYNNLGITLQEQGKLAEAIDAYKKALAIKPDNADAVENSQSLLVQLLPILGIWGYNYNIGEVQTNSKIVLRPRYQIHNVIKAYLEADFVQAKSHNDMYKTCDHHLLDGLELKNKVFCSAYSSFVEKLLDAQWDEEHASENTLYHLGESHSLSYAHRNITIGDSNFRITPRITFGAKAFHFSRNMDDKFKAITKAHFASLPKNSKVFLSFGEIDCRPNEGFISAAGKLNKSLEELIDQTTSCYVEWFSEQNKGKEHHLYFINVPAPVYDEKLTTDLNSEVARTVALFNASLKKYSLQYGFDIVDVFKFTAGKEGISNGLFHIDGYHLGAKALPEIERQLS